eukprot:5485861-Pleurochrysis_carterae.AAC.2
MPASKTCCNFCRTMSRVGSPVLATGLLLKPLDALEGEGAGAGAGAGAAFFALAFGAFKMRLHFWITCSAKSRTSRSQPSRLLNFTTTLLSLVALRICSNKQITSRRWLNSP